MSGMVRIVTVVGARPQFIKAATVSRALAAEPRAEEVMVHTGQHYDREMSALFFEQLGIPDPAHHLGIGGGGHGEMTGRMLIALEAVLQQERPHLLLCYGDTNSTLAAALAAAKLHIPVAHVEAGLRSFNRRMPEELNRVLTDHLSHWLFCPTSGAVTHLAREGITAGVALVGDVMYDATLHVARQVQAWDAPLERLGVRDGAYLLATLHRAENTGDAQRLAALLGYLRSLAGGRPVVLPLHPRTRQAVARFRLSLDGLLTCPPCGYREMHRLLMGAALVATDSGGVQKEAYFHRVPCVTLREETEWTETVAAGWNRLWREPQWRPRREIAEYGDGHAAGRIVAALLAGGADRAPGAGSGGA